MAPTHIVTDFQPVPAPGPGGIPGFAATCSCGSVISSSLKALTWSWANDHIRYYTEKEAGK